uniref:ZAD domain-containing protein n=1 Tax=Ceratitis capitata TaxID=7213 RepID=W8AXG7_CERCA
MTSLLSCGNAIGQKLDLTLKEEYLNGEQYMNDANTLDPEAYIIENAKCFLCDRNFVEGEGTFLIFEIRLRDDGGIDNPLSLILSTALGKDLDENSSHSPLLCESCNKNILEFERLLQKFCEKRMQIIKSYNRTVHKYNIDPIIIDCESEVTRGDSIYFDEISNNIIIDDLHCKNKSSNCDDSPNGSNESKEMESICVGADLVEEIIDCDPIEVDGSILNPDSPCMENNEDLINDIHCNGTISDISDKAEQGNSARKLRCGTESDLLLLMNLQQHTYHHEQLV